MISNDQLKNFLTNILKIKDWEIVSKDTPRSEKINLLRRIVKSHVHNVYFQNVSMAATNIEKRHAPTLEDIVNVGLTSRGGVCIELNYFLRLVFDCLGYDTFTVAANIAQGSVRDSHCCTIVRINEDEMFLVDVSSGLPIDEPIPLHQLPYRRIAAGYPYEYRKTDDGIYQRWQLGGSFTKGDFVNGEKEALRYFFTLEPKTLKYFDTPMNEVFTNPKVSCFLKNTFVFRHFIDENDTKEKEKFILVWGTTVVIGGKENRDIVTYKNYKELIPVLHKYFPNLIDSEVESALNVWSQFEITFTKYIG